MAVFFVLAFIVGDDNAYEDRFYAFAQPSPSEDKNSVVLEDPNLKAEVVYSGFGFPTTMAFLSPNDMLILQKNNGTVKRFVNGVMLEDPLLKVNVGTEVERGMLGIAVMNNKDINKNPYVFLYFTLKVLEKENGIDKTDNYTYRNQLYRYDFVDDKLVNPLLLLDFPVKSEIHNGGALTIGPDNNLYVVIGDNRLPDPQKRTPDGKAGILRLTAEGLPVTEDGTKGILGDTVPLSLYYAYGIRNSFGLSFDPVTGKLWDTENGPNYGDEVNLVEPGFNSGWRSISGFWQNENENIDDITLEPDELSDIKNLHYSPPEFAWFDPIGVNALTFIDSDKYGKEYANDMIIGGYISGSLYHFNLNDERNELMLDGASEDKIAIDGNDNDQNIIFGRGFGGITDVKVGPDGYIYVLSSLFLGDNCKGGWSSNEPCGTLFRIIPENGH